MATVENTRENSTVGTPIDVLPSIEELPAADVVIYDGKCNFCRAGVRRLNWFTSGKVAYISLHDPRVADLYPQLTYDQMMQQLYVVTNDDQTLGGAKAIRYLSRQCPKLWVIAPLLHIPFSIPIWQYLYDMIARSRYLIAGRTDDCEGGTCELHFKKRSD